MTGIEDAGAVCPNCGWPRPLVAFTGMCGECTVRERDRARGEHGHGETARVLGGRRDGNGEGSIG